jgi:chromosome segregation ATPase
VQQRDLMKAISKKENDLDKMQDALEKAEKKTKEKIRGLEAAMEDKAMLSRAISKAEEKLAKVKEDQERNGHATTSVTGRLVSLIRP